MLFCTFARVIGYFDPCDSRLKVKFMQNFRPIGQSLCRREFTNIHSSTVRLVQVARYLHERKASIHVGHRSHTPQRSKHIYIQYIVNISFLPIGRQTLIIGPPRNNEEDLLLKYCHKSYAV